jgi:competence protein ComGC
VVTTLLGVLTAVVVAGIAGMQERTARIACDADVATVALAAQSYFIRHSGYPAGVDELTREGYLTSPVRDDHTVVYARDLTANSFTVTGSTSSGVSCLPAGG